MLRAGLALICLCWGTWCYSTWQVTCWGGLGMMYQWCSLAWPVGNECPFWHFNVYQPPQKKMCLRRRNQNLRWCVRQSLRCRNRAQHVRGEVGNCSVGILFAFATADDVWEQQKVSPYMWSRPQPLSTSASTFPRLWVWACLGTPWSTHLPGSVLCLTKTSLKSARGLRKQDKAASVAFAVTPPKLATCRASTAPVLEFHVEGGNRRQPP